MAILRKYEGASVKDVENWSELYGKTVYIRVNDDVNLCPISDLSFIDQKIASISKIVRVEKKVAFAYIRKNYIVALKVGSVVVNGKTIPSIDMFYGGLNFDIKPETFTAEILEVTNERL